MATSTVAMRSAQADPAAVARRSTDLRLLTLSRGHAPARSADLIAAETCEAFPLAGGRALQVVSTEAVFMAAVVDATATDDGSIGGKTRGIKNGEKPRVFQDLTFYSALIEKIFWVCNRLTFLTFPGVCSDIT